MSESSKVDLKRPLLAVSGFILDADHPELRALELAQRYFERKVGERGATEEEVCNTLVWLAGARVQLHNGKGAMHTLAHLRARSRGRFKEIENVASLLEILLHHEMREARQGLSRLELLRLSSPDPRTQSRLDALQHQLRGRFLSALGQLKPAQEEFEQALKVLNSGPAQLEDSVIRVEIFGDQAQTQHREGRGEEALKTYAIAETAAKHIEFSLAVARSLRGRGNVHLSRKENNDAIRFFKEALEVYQRNDAPYGILRCSINIGRAYYAVADLREALYYFEEARMQCGKGRYPNEEAEVNARIGDIMLSEGQYEKAAEFYEQDLQLANVHGDERSRAHALRNVGRIQRLLANFSRSEACLEEAGILLTRLGDRLGLIQTLQQIVMAYLEQGKTAQARRSLNILKEHAEKLGRPHEQGIAQMLEGIVLRHEGHAEQARISLDRSLAKLSREPGFFTVLCQVESAQAHFELGDKATSVLQFKEAIQSARRLSHRDIERRALNLLAKVDRAEWARALNSGNQGGHTDDKISRSVLMVLTFELRGSDWLWHQEPERVHALLDGYYETVASTVRRQKGVLNRIVGLRMYAVYGLDATCDPVQAVRCAELCLEAFARLQAENQHYNNLGLAVSLATGQSLHGMMGPADHLAYAIVGPAWETSGRLVDHAQSGEIWICSDTHRAVRHLENTVSPRDLVERGEEGKAVAYVMSSTRQLPRKPTPYKT